MENSGQGIRKRLLLRVASRAGVVSVETPEGPGATRPASPPCACGMAGLIRMRLDGRKTLLETADMDQISPKLSPVRPTIAAIQPNDIGRVAYLALGEPDLLP